MTGETETRRVKDDAGGGDLGCARTGVSREGPSRQDSRLRAGQGRNQDEHGVVQLFKDQR